MKRKIILLLMVSIFIYGNSQTIDLVGVGVHSQTNANLTFSNLSNISKVKVNAIYKGRGIPSINDVQFYNTNQSTLSTWSTDIIIKHYSGVFSQTLGYYSSSFHTVDASGINVTINPLITDKVHSYLAFVHRNDITSDYQSFISNEMSFYFRNSSNDPYVYNIPINIASKSRKVIVKVPITELDAGTRNAVVNITVGSATRTESIQSFNFGNSLFIGEYEFDNVPGHVDNVSVSIYSPNPYLGDATSGDSFFVSGIVVDVEKNHEGSGCTLTQGYWKTHSSCKRKGPKRDDTWDKLENAENTEFFLSEQNYCDVFATKPGKEGKYYILAHQYIAAELNILNGADPTEVKETFNQATLLLKSYKPSDVNNSTELKNHVISLASVLTDYNEGTIGPGHCDDVDTSANKEEDDTTVLLDVYPNPFVNYVDVNFKNNVKGKKLKVELYNLSGKRVSLLFNDKVKGNLSRLRLDVSKIKRGNYIIVVKNNVSVLSKGVVKM